MSAEVLMTSQYTNSKQQDDEAFYMELQTIKQHSSGSTIRETHCIVLNNPCHDDVNESEWNEISNSSPVPNNMLTERGWMHLIDSIRRIIEEHKCITSYRKINKLYNTILGILCLQATIALVTCIYIVILSIVFGPDGNSLLGVVIWVCISWIMALILGIYECKFQAKFRCQLLVRLKFELSILMICDPQSLYCDLSIRDDDHVLILHVSFPQIAKQCMVCSRIQRMKEEFCTECGTNYKAIHLNHCIKCAWLSILKTDCDSPMDVCMKCGQQTVRSKLKEFQQTTNISVL
jgi:hypothetical protein